jgi:hypothetical protein
MKYAIEMTKKSFDVDLQNLFNLNSDFKKRKNPKKAILGNEIIYTIAFVAILGISIHIICLFLSSWQFETELYNYQIMRQQGDSVVEVYIDSQFLYNYADH